MHKSKGKEMGGRVTREERSCVPIGVNVNAAEYGACLHASYTCKESSTRSVEK